MKKYTTNIVTDTGETKSISVFLDDVTANILDLVNDDNLTDNYISEEYQDNLVARKEIRRLVSLDQLIEQGHEIAEEYDCAEEIYRNDQKAQLRAALETLTDLQYKVLWARHIDNLSFREIGRRLGISKTTVTEHFYAAEEKIKLFFKKHPAKM